MSHSMANSKPWNKKGLHFIPLCAPNVSSANVSWDQKWTSVLFMPYLYMLWTIFWASFSVLNNCFQIKTKETCKLRAFFRHPEQFIAFTKTRTRTSKKMVLNSLMAFVELKATLKVRFTGSSIEKSWAVHSTNFLFSFLKWKFWDLQNRKLPQQETGLA